MNEEDTLYCTINKLSTEVKTLIETLLEVPVWFVFIVLITILKIEHKIKHGRF